MYGFSKDDLENIQSQTRTSPFPVNACVDDVCIEDCKVEELGSTGIKCISLYWSRANNTQVLRQSIIEINKENVFDRAIQAGKDKNEALNTEVIRFKSKLKHILNELGYSDAEVLSGLVGNSFQEVGDNFSKLVTADRCKSQKLYMKTVRNKKGYVECAAFPPFIQNMSGGSCTLRYSKYELSKLEQNMEPTATITEDEPSANVVQQPAWDDI
jgi:hypothetical protein